MLCSRGLFGLRGLHVPQDWQTIKHQTLKACNDLVYKILSNREGSVLQDFDELSDTLCQVLDASELARNVSSEPEHVEASESVFRELSQYMQELNCDENLCGALLRKQDAVTCEEQALVRSLQRDFALRGGASLSPSKRKHVAAVQNEILEWSMRVTAVFRDAEKSPGKRFGSANVNIAWNSLTALLNKRSELAQVLSYPSYAHFVALDKLLRHPHGVVSFLNSVSSMLNEVRRKRQHDSLSLQRSRCSSLARRLQPYLGVDSVLEVLSGLLCELFGIRIYRLRQNQVRGVIWHPSVEHAMLVDARNGNFVGEVFFDLFARDGKMPGAAHYALRGSRRLRDGSSQLPSAAIVCDFPPIIRKAGMQHYQLETLLHELGHVLHTIMSRTRFQHLSGTRGPMDFVEIPSHLMENFAWDAAWMRRFAPNGPRQFLAELEEARQEAVVAEIALQTPFAALDLALHSHDHFGWGNEARSKIKRIIAEVVREYGRLEQVLYRDGIPYMPHIIGYGGCYYSYLLARILAAEVWNRLFRDSKLSMAAAGELLRNGFFRFGASKEPREILATVLNGEEPSFRGIAEAIGMADSQYATLPVLASANRSELCAEPSA
jgi:intermediate peptidase